MTDFKPTQTGNIGSISLSGDLTLERAAWVKAALLDAFDKKSIVVRFSDVTSIDLSLIQLICSAYGKARTSDKSFMLAEPVPDIVMQAVRDSGFSSHEAFSRSTNEVNERSPGEDDE